MERFGVGEAHIAQGIADERWRALMAFECGRARSMLWAGAPRDPYDCIVDRLLSLLSRNASKEEVTAFLEREVAEQFGTAAPNASQFAAKAVTWFQMLSREEE